MHKNAASGCHGDYRFRNGKKSERLGPGEKCATDFDRVTREKHVLIGSGDIKSVQTAQKSTCFFFFFFQYKTQFDFFSYLHSIFFVFNDFLFCRTFLFFCDKVFLEINKILHLKFIEKS